MRPSPARSAVVCVLLAGMTAAGLAGAPQAEPILLSAPSLLGPRIPGPYLFEVDRFHLAQVVIGSADQIREVAVHSTFYYRDLNPPWENPQGFRNLSKAQHDDLIQRVDRLRPLGALTKAGLFGFVVFLRTHFEDEYANALVNWQTGGPDKRYNYENLIVRFKSSAPPLGVQSVDVLKAAERVFGPSQQPAILFDLNVFYVARRR